VTEEQAETLIRSLESGHAGIEAFIGLSADDRAEIMSLLEERAGAKELRQILEQCEAGGQRKESAHCLPNSGKVESSFSNRHFGPSRNKSPFPFMSSRLI
jgi:hypothetical protein